MDGFDFIALPRSRFGRMVGFDRHPTILRIYNSLAALNPRLYFYSKTVCKFDYVIGVDSYTGLTVALLSLADGTNFAYRPNDCLFSLGTQLFRYDSKILALCIVGYSVLVENSLSRIARFLIVPSRKVGSDFARLYGFRRDCFLFPPLGSTGVKDEGGAPGRKLARELMGIQPRFFVLLFLGVGDWLPNKLAIQYILTKLGPQLEVVSDEIVILIVGKHTEHYKNQIQSTNIRVLGQVDDLGPILRVSDLGIVPSTVVGGISSKAVEYLCSGLPVLATEAVVETIIPQTGVFSAKISEFAEAVQRVRSSVANINRGNIKSEAQRNYDSGRLGFVINEKIDQDH